jgi:hypothetical protein
MNLKIGLLLQQQPLTPEIQQRPLRWQHRHQPEAA